MQDKFVPKKQNAVEEKGNSDYIFVCPKCGKEISPSSICEDCFPNGGDHGITTDQASFLDAEILNIDQYMVSNEIQSHQVLEDKGKNTVVDSDLDQFTWQDFLQLLKLLTTFYKRYKKKVWLVSSIVVLTIAAYTSYQHFSPKGKLILFAEKKDLVFTYTKNPLEKHIIKKKWNSKIKDMTPGSNYFSAVRASQDEKYIFYREQTNVREMGDELDSYYRFDIENNKKMKMDDQVHITFTGGSTNISPDGSKAIYLKGTDNKLVFWNNGKKKIIDEMVSFYLVNKQTTHVFYIKQQGFNSDNQSEIYEWSEKSGKKTVAEKAQFQGFQMDQNGELVICFKKNQTIYCKKGDKQVKLISTKADSILSYCGEKVYYTVSSTLPFTYRDFVVDSLEESDKKIEQPTSSTNSGEQYFQKTQRDLIRQSFDKQITTIVSDLYYFDGKKSTLLDKNIGVSNFYQTTTATKESLQIYRKMDDNMLQHSKIDEFEQQKIDISKVYDLYQLDGYISQLLNRNSKMILAQGIKKGIIEQNRGTQFMLSINGKWIGFIDDSLENNQEPWNSNFPQNGKLKKFKIDNLTNFKPTVVDDKVNTNFFFKGNDIFYTKVTSEGNKSLDLYVNGKILLKNVDDSTNASFDLYRYFGLTEISDENTFYGLVKPSKNLYEINGNSKRKLAKNVEIFVPLKDKSIIYIKDFKINEGYGKLLVNDGKNKPILVSNKASMIFQNNEFLMYY
jgi:hypothetical protein